MQKKASKKGFTLIELLIVIGVVGILAALAFVALNPLARFQDARNAQRWTNISAIMSAIKLHQVDNGGAYIDAISDLTAGRNLQIGYNQEMCVNPCLNPTITIYEGPCVDLRGLVTGGYLAELPVDPNCTGATEEITRYYLSKNSTGTITVGSCCEELGSNSSIPDISITR